MDNKESRDSVEERRKKFDADAGNDGSSNQMLQQEKLIDPGNEHNHLDDDDWDKKFDADAGTDAPGGEGHEPGEGEDEEPDTSGEDG